MFLHQLVCSDRRLYFAAVSTSPKSLTVDRYVHDPKTAHYVPGHALEFAPFTPEWSPRPSILAARAWQKIETPVVERVMVDVVYCLRARKERPVK